MSEGKIEECKRVSAFGFCLFFFFGENLFSLWTRRKNSTIPCPYRKNAGYLVKTVETAALLPQPPPPPPPPSSLLPTSRHYYIAYTYTHTKSLLWQRAYCEKKDCKTFQTKGKKEKKYEWKKLNIIWIDCKALRQSSFIFKFITARNTKLCGRNRW